MRLWLKLSFYGNHYAVWVTIYEARTHQWKAISSLLTCYGCVHDTVSHTLAWAGSSPILGHFRSDAAQFLCSVLCRHMPQAPGKSSSHTCTKLMLEDLTLLTLLTPAINSLTCSLKLWTGLVLITLVISLTHDTHVLAWGEYKDMIWLY